ncbi:MAG: DUF3179 domain-containing protein [Rhodospirillales bacterium]|nr:DUF3179 domain-containing protein [Rhodospirillales bacterium]
MQAHRFVAVVVLAAFGLPVAGLASPADPWRAEWPRTDFARHTVPLEDIISGGPPKDGIPSIDDPRFVPVAASTDLSPQEPVIGLIIDGDARAYPLRILHWHEIVNDVVGGRPVAVIYCPLCNLPLVWDRRLEGCVLDFGTTGKLRHSDLVMYDRATESWWQQATGTAIIGTLAGERLKEIPSRLESFARFRERAPTGRVLVPADPTARPYGVNPYAGYDSAGHPFLYRGDVPGGSPPMARVVAIGNEAWSLELLRQRRRIETDDLIISWDAGQASALDTRQVADGRDVGNILVQRHTASGLEDAAHMITFAFAFFAFHPEGVLHTPNGAVHGEGRSG